MTQPISDYLIDQFGNPDPYAPPVPKPDLQQYDNYQIHDLYCTDLIFSDNQNVIFQHFLAVEAASPLGNILCDFTAIAIAHP